MKAIKFDECNIEFAKDQPQYQPLTGYKDEEGRTLFCFELDDEEMEQAKESLQIFITVLTFLHPLQPIHISTEKPEIPIHPLLSYSSSPVYKRSEGKFTFQHILGESGLKRLNKSRHIWVSVLTFDKPLQPIGVTTLCPEDWVANL